MVKQFILLLVIFNLLNAIPCKPTIESPASITRDLIVALPGNEKINRRSVDDSMESDEDSSEENFTTLGDDSDEVAYDNSENYTPSVSIFAAEPPQIPLRMARSTDMQLAENEMGFLPFLSQKSNFEDGQRVVRSIDNTNNENGDGMVAAENGLVFRSLFRTKNNFRQRVARSIERSNNAESDDEMDTAENGMVFLPVFRTRSSSGIKDRVRRNIDTFNADKYVDDMETAASGIIFRPVFRTNNRFATGLRSRRSVNYDLSISPTAVNVRNLNDLHSRKTLRANRSTKQKESLFEESGVNSIPKNMAFRS